MTSEKKVGLLFLLTIALVVVFAYVLGAFNPFTNSKELVLAYNFAGGIEEGSPVRVMGIKVGKVKSIQFAPDLKAPSGEPVNLKVRVAIDRKAWKTLKSDSRFYINLAGVIGEKFIEATPGGREAAPLKPGQVIRGEDPPRIDQLISQSYGLAGKVMEFVEQNEGSLIETIETMNHLVVNLNTLMKEVDKTANRGDIQKLIKNMAVLSDDLVYYSDKVRSQEGQKTMALINQLIWRLDELDKEAIKEFFQEEGIKAKLF